MTSGSNFPDLVEPLTVGNVVSAGFRLYSSNLKPYLRIALIGTLWVLLPLLAVIPVVLFFTATNSNYALLGLIIPALLVLLLFCSAKYMANSAAIARLAFGELINQPEAPSTANRFTQSRQWSFLLMGFLLFLIFAGMTITMYILAAIFIAIIFVAIGGAEFLRNPTSAALVNPSLIVVSGLVFLAVLVIFLLLFAWFSVRFSISDMPLAIEQDATATQSIGRSWELTGKNVWRIFLILFVTGLITLPIQALVQVFVSLSQEAIAFIYPEESPTFLLLSTLSGYILGMAASIVTLPLWQTIKAVIYYDLRSRREGLDLQIRDREPPFDTELN